MDTNDWVTFHHQAQSYTFHQTILFLFQLEFSIRLSISLIVEITLFILYRHAYL